MDWRRGSFFTAIVAVATLAAVWAQEGPPEDQLPRYDEDGALLRPEGWETWVMVGASIGLDYEGEGQPRLVGDPGMFHNVFMQPWAYRHYMECKAVGRFPDDPIVRRNAGIIRRIEDAQERSRTDYLQKLVALRLRR